MPLKKKIRRRVPKPFWEEQQKLDQRLQQSQRVTVKLTVTLTLLCFNSGAYLEM